MLPLGVIEASHFAGSIVGAALLLLSQGLAHRLDAAYFLTVIAIAVGIVASLLKGADYEEAALLGLMLLVLWRARPAFDRRTALIDTRFSTGWTMAIAGAMGASLWLGFFAFKHVDTRKSSGGSSRFAAGVPHAARVGWRGRHPGALCDVPSDPPRPSRAPRAHRRRPGHRRIDYRGAGSTMPFLVYRDKAVLFENEREGFVMYAVQGRTWVALGDPVCAESRQGPLIRAFLERCDDFGGVPVFYEISKDHLHRYADLGLTFVKLGEEARVDLHAFTLEGGHARKHRQAVRRLQDAGATFRVMPVEEVGRRTEELHDVSTDWLSEPAGGENAFSLGSFNPDYVSRFPSRSSRWTAGHPSRTCGWVRTQEISSISCDSIAARLNVMESLFVHMMLWARDRSIDGSRSG